MEARQRGKKKREEGVESNREERCIVSRVKQLFGSAYQSKVDDLRNHALMLRISRNRFKAAVDAAKREAEGKESCAPAWVARAEEALKGASELIHKGVEAKEKYFLGLIPNLKARSNFCRKAKEKAEDLVNVDKEPRSDKNQQHPIHPDMTEVTIQGLVGGDIENYVALPSRQLLLGKLIDALTDLDPRVRKIGLYGIQGVGKTTLAKQLYRRVTTSRNDLFNAVVMVSVTQKPDFGVIRSEIASALGIQLGDWIGSRKRAASDQGSSGLKEKNILVILDDIWKPFDLEDVGIPEDDYKFRTLLISEKANKLTRMGVSTMIELEVLSEEEARSLFLEIAGDSQSSELQHMATQVGRQRPSLPFTIVVVASVWKVRSLFREEERIRKLIESELKYKKWSIWELLEFKLKQNPESVISDIVKQFRSCAVTRFLSLCGRLDGSQISTMDLAIYSMCLHVFEETEVEEKDAINRTHEYVKMLLDCSLLLPGKFKGFVEIHDIVRGRVSRYSSFDIKSKAVEEQMRRMFSQS